LASLIYDKSAQQYIYIYNNFRSMNTWLIHLKPCLMVPCHAYWYTFWNGRSHQQHQQENWSDETTQWYDTLRLREELKMEKWMESINGTLRAHSRMIDCWVHKDYIMIDSFSSDSIAHFAFGGKPSISTNKLVSALIGSSNAQLLEHNWHMSVF
jgi:hypothetical protein